MQSRQERVAAGFAVACLGLRAWMLASAYYLADDFRYLSAATRTPFWSFLLQDYQGHLMPGQFLLVWIHQHLFPMAYWPAAVVTIALQAASSTLMWRMLKELVGVSWSAVAAFVVALFAPLSTTAFVWYPAALQAIPLQLVVAGALLHQTRLLRLGRRRDLWWCVAWYVLGLFMWEKAAMLPVLGMLVATTLTPVRDGWSGAVHTWWRLRRLWLLYAALTGLYLTAYFSLTEPVDRGLGAPLTAYLRIARDALWQGGITPYLIGGPLSAGTASFAGPVIPHGWLYLSALVCIVVVTVLRHTTAWRAWLLLATYVVGALVVTTAGRFPVWQYSLGFLPRYYTDVVVVAAVVLAVALRPTPELLRLERRSRPASPRLAGLGVAALTLFLGTSLVSSIAISSGFPFAANRSLIETAKADLTSLTDPVLLDTVLSSPSIGQHSASELLTPLPNAPRFDAPTEQLYTLHVDGHLIPWEFAGGAVAPPGPEGTCGYSVVKGVSTAVQFPSVITSWTWVVELTYFTGADATLLFEIDNEQQAVRVHEGAHAVYFVVHHSIDRILLGSPDATAPVCVVGVAVARGTVG